MSKSILYKLSTTNDKFTSRSGLILITEILRQMEVDNLANRYFPAPGSNRGFSPATYIRAFVLMRLEGGRCLEDIRHLQAESARLSMLGNWLRRMGQSRAGLRGLEALNRHLLKAALGTRRSVTLDLDATAILCDKRETRYTYLYERGYMPIVAHIAEVGMILSPLFRHGNVPPSTDNLEFILQCEKALPAGVKIRHLRIDAAGYQAAILDYAAEQGMAFAIRATDEQEPAGTASEACGSGLAAGCGSCRAVERGRVVLSAGAQHEGVDGGFYAGGTAVTEVGPAES